VALPKPLFKADDFCGYAQGLSAFFVRNINNFLEGFLYA